MKTPHTVLALIAGGLLSTAPAHAGDRAGKTPGVQGSNALGLKVLRAVHSEGQNVCISPTSLGVALRMASEGAEGETRSELAQALGAGALRAQDVSQGPKLSLEGVSLRFANSIWAPEHGGALLPPFVASMKSNFAAEVRTVDMSDPAMVSEINRWVKSATQGQVPQVIDEIPSDATTYLINAIAFKGSWSTPFDKAHTGPAAFLLADGGAHSVQLMRNTANLACLLDGTTSVVQLPYGRDEVASMWVAVPETASGLSALVEGMNLETLARWKANARKQPCDVALPRFKLRSSTPMKAALEGLGIKAAFDSTRADFSRMAVGGKDLYVSRVLHETSLELSEAGTQASAATAVEVAPGGMPLSVNCDRPFLILVEDHASSSILFVGAVYRP